jgi:hypothetical protein
MKKRDVIIIAVVGACIVLLAVFQVTLTVRQNAFETRESLSVVEPGGSASENVSDIDNSGDVSATEDEEEQTDAEKTEAGIHLARLPTRDEILAAKDTTRGADRAFMKVYIGGLKRFESAAWIADKEFAEKFAGEIGSESLNLGDLETARDYLRIAVKTESKDRWRHLFQGRLAWVEEDPQEVERLLGQSVRVK